LWHPLPRQEYGRYVAPLDGLQAQAAALAGGGQPPRQPWTRADDDALASLAKRYDLRWPVIFDRWSRKPDRRVEELQHRYLTVAQALLRSRHRRYASEATSAQQQQRQQQQQQQQQGGGGLGVGGAGRAGGEDPVAAAAIEARAAALGVSLTAKYSLAYEEARRAQLEALWSRPKEDDKSEAELKEELKQVDAELKRLKKVITSKVSKKGAALAIASTTAAAPGPAAAVAAGTGADDAAQEPAAAAAVAASAEASAEASALLGLDDSDEAGRAAVARLVGRPYRLSSRLAMPLAEAEGGSAPKGSGLSRALLGKLEALLGELQVGARGPGKGVFLHAVCWKGGEEGVLIRHRVF